MLTREIGKRMLNNTLQAIEWISDKEYQKRVWIGGEGPNDFDETACHFFDNGDPVLEEYKLCDITEGQYQLLKNFRDRFRVFSEEHSYELEFIDTPEWLEITELAKEVLKTFDYKCDVKVDCLPGVQTHEDKMKIDKELDTTTFDSAIKKSAEILDDQWLMCPDCIDAWESTTRDAIVICPKCEQTLHNPRYAK